MGSEVTGYDGYASRGGEVCYFDPNSLVIVGLDVPETEENWWAHCPRLKTISDADLAEYVESILATKSGKPDDPVDGVRVGDKIILVDGRSTARAARLARAAQAKRGVKKDLLCTVRVLLRQGDETERFRINVDSHKNRPLTTTQQAQMVFSYFMKTGEDEGKTSAFFRIDQQSVKNAVAMSTRLSSKLKQALDQKVLPMREALKLVKLSEDEQTVVFDGMVEAGATKGAAASNAIREGKKAIAEARKKGEKPSKVKIAKVDKSRMRPKDLLERLRHELKDDKAYGSEVALIDFILGGSPSKLDKGVQEALVAAGWKGGREEKNKSKAKSKTKKAA